MHKKEACPPKVWIRQSNTPNNRSTCAPVEIWFNIITQKAIRRGSFRSVKELNDKYNETSHPFVWTSTARSIIQKAQRFCKAISGTEHVGVHFQLAELKRTEFARPEPRKGWARKHLEDVHEEPVYDLEVDKTASDPDTNAGALVPHLASREFMLRDPNLSEVCATS